MYGLMIHSFILRAPIYEANSTPYMCSRCIRPASFLPYRWRLATVGLSGSKE
jgi:hypothetical protein